jgi:transcription antitermination factor NusG
MSSLQPITTPDALTAAPDSLDGHEWYALHTRARLERRICGQVQSKSQEAFVPVTRERRRWSDRFRTIDLPLFPGYVFVRAALSLNDRLAILQTRGVYGFVTFNGVIARIPHQQIDYLQQITEQNSAWSPYHFIKTGQRIRIRGGCLDGLEGIFVSEGTGKKLVISIEPMQRSIAVSVDTYDFEMA